MPPKKGLAAAARLQLHLGERQRQTDRQRRRETHTDRDEEVLELEDVSDEDEGGGEALGPAEIEAALGELDPDGSREITFEQFYVWWEKREADRETDRQRDRDRGAAGEQSMRLPGAIYAVAEAADTKEPGLRDRETDRERQRAIQAAGRSQPKRKLGCCARFKICLRRCVETEVRGARVPDLLSIVAAFFVPVADVSSDWAVVYGFHLDCALFNGVYDEQTKQARFAATEGAIESPCTWRNWGLYTMGLGGLFSAGFLFDRMVRLGGKYAAAAFPAAVLSLVGLAPVFHAALALMLQDPKGGKATLKVAKGIELIFEAIPQSSLQAYVLVIDDRLSWSNDTKWDPLLGASVLISFFGAGTTLFGLEASARQRGFKLPEFAAFSRYGLLVACARAVQIAAMAFGVALVGCAGAEVHGASFVVLVIICTVAVYFYEPTQLRSTLSAWAALALYVVGVMMMRASYMYLRDTDGIAEQSDSLLLGGSSRGSSSNSGWNTTLSCSATATCACNTTALNATQHSRLGDPTWRTIDGACCGESVWDTAQWLLFAMGFALVVLMNCVDPVIGQPCLHAMSHAKKVARDAAKAGLTSEQVAQAKVEQVWNWIDYFSDGQIEPQEIYRLAQRVVPSGGPPAERFGYYSQLCAKLSVPALTWPEFEANKKAGVEPAGGLERFCITKEHFSQYRGNIGSEIFDALRLPLLKSQGIRGILGC